MKKELMEQLLPRQEMVTVGSVTLLVRELQTAADLTALITDPKNPDPDWGFKLLVKCCFDPATGEPAFEMSDVEHLKGGSRWKLADLLAAVNRVNGLSVEENVKNSEAVQASGSSGS